MQQIGIEIIDKGMGYVIQGIEFIRNILGKVASWISFGNPELVLAIVYLVASFILARLLVRRFVTRPLELPYLLWFIIIMISIFLNLFYLGGCM